MVERGGGRGVMRGGGRGVMRKGCRGGAGAGGWVAQATTQGHAENSEVLWTAATPPYFFGISRHAHRLAD
eukprot:751572-Hanusia_phi.AAC.1